MAYQPIASDPAALADDYPCVVIGSGYGGAVTAARLAEAGRPVCVLERGREMLPGDFADTGAGLAGTIRRKENPLGYVDYYLCDDIDVLKGNGLGGTSLINANVALRPDREVFDDLRWPRAWRDLAGSGAIWSYYERAERMLGVNPHPRALALTKAQMVGKRAAQLTDARFAPVNVSVHFGEDGPNHLGVHQRGCNDCGDCVTGCNVGAKGTLRMNYLPYAKAKGAEIFTRVEVRHLERAPGGGYDVYYRCNDGTYGEVNKLRARSVVLSAGTLGSTEILLRSAAQGLPLSGRLGQGFSGNGDYLGLAYNTNFRTDVLGFGNRPGSERAEVRPGPTIVTAIQYDRGKPVAERITVEDFTTFPSGLVDTFRRALPALALTGKDTDWTLRDEVGEAKRVGLDLLGWNPDGASNHSMVYLVMAIDNCRGRMVLDEKNKLRIRWPGLNEDPIFARIHEELVEHARALGGTYVHLGRFNPWKLSQNLITAHPMGGCALGDDADRGVIDPDGRAFDGEGGTHEGLYVVDGASAPMALGVNPFLTISAIAERLAERMVAGAAA